MDTKHTRVISWFSCGAASAVASKLAVDKYGDKAMVVYYNTMADEHPDNKRFMADVEQWIGKRVTIISSEKYKSVDDVFEVTRYMSGIAGARCTVEMKRIPRLVFQEPYDLHIFGFTADEPKRMSRFEANNPELFLEWILEYHKITKQDCYRILLDAGIDLPVMYKLGFKNNNCKGCVKATSPSYWAMVRKHFPDTFSKRARQSRELGVRLVRLKGERIFLDELPEGDFKNYRQENISCGPECGLIKP